MISIYTKAINLLPREHIGNWQSDLYIKKCELSDKLIQEYEPKNNVKIFTSQIDNSPWYEIPFAYDPYWNKLINKVENEKKQTTSLQ